MSYCQTKDSCACCDPAYRQFDFWLGNWQAVVNDTVGGHNDILVLQDGCLIQENWRSANGNYTGTSYNYFDATTQKWNQVWIDNQGQSLRLIGGIRGKAMILTSEKVANSASDTLIHRITWTPLSPDRVPQLWQSRSRHNIEEWKTLFDGEYQRLAK